MHDDTLPCADCRTAFYPAKPSAVYCSSACRARAYRRRVNAALAELRELKAAANYEGGTRHGR